MPFLAHEVGRTSRVVPGGEDRPFHPSADRAQRALINGGAGTANLVPLADGREAERADGVGA
jgi:hypothetical protein